MTEGIQAHPKIMLGKPVIAGTGLPTGHRGGVKVVADEDVAAQIVEALRADGHEVTYLAELAPSTAP